MRAIGLLIGVATVIVGARGADAQPVPGTAPLRVVPWVTGFTQPVGLVADPVSPRLQYVIEAPAGSA